MVWNRNEPPSLLRNRVKPGNHWLEVTLTGTRSNRAAIGALVTVEFGGQKQVQAVLSQSSFTSASDLRLHYGLGSATAAKLVVHWPSGLTETFDAPKVDQAIQLTEGSAGGRRNQ